MRGVYIHIPFCHQICHYCDFNKVFFQNQPVDAYVECIGKELAIMNAEGYSFSSVETVFLGGGTPTALSVPQLERLLEILHQYIPLSSVKEFTTEANPDELTAEKLTVLKEGGINRLSIGVQTFDEELLRKIGRTHSPKEAIQVIDLAQKMGFDNVSIDLIYGLPTQTIHQWQETLHQATALNLPHFSAYSLIVEPKTVFYNLLHKGKLPLPGEDTEAAMLQLLMEHMEANGLWRYEISNYAQKGFESRHNLIYWDNDEYAGIGAGAHGYTNGVRYANIGPLKKYMGAVEAGERPTVHRHVVSQQEAMEEEMFLGLRKTSGVNAELFQKKFRSTIEDVYGKELQQLIKQQLLQFVDGHYQLTQQGVFQGNHVFQQFLK